MTTYRTNKLDTSLAGIAAIKKHEGLRLHVYDDIAGHPTIGYGHLLTKRERGLVREITYQQAEALLRYDIFIPEMYINTHVKVPLNQHQFDALVSFVFNLGVGNFRKSTLLKKLNRGDYTGAANELLRWNKFFNPNSRVYEPSRGLTNRRQAERAMFLGVL